MSSFINLCKRKRFNFFDGVVVSFITKPPECVKIFLVRLLEMYLNDLETFFFLTKSLTCFNNYVKVPVRVDFIGSTRLALTRGRDDWVVESVKANPTVKPCADIVDRSIAVQ